MSATVYLNGRFLPESQALVSVYDGGWLHGAGLFETMRAEKQRVFRLESHMERLRRSASALLAPLDDRTLPRPEVFTELLDRNGLQDARVRLTLSAGSVRDTTGGPPGEMTLCVTAAELAAPPPAFYTQGVNVVISNARVSPTDPIAGHKTTGYLPRLLGLRDAQRARCAEALWFTTGNLLAEGCISNVFLISGKAIRTPPLDTPVLPGIARGIVLQLARELQLQTQEVPLTIDDLLQADEIILTNSIMQVLPVIRVEAHDVGGGRVGSVARQLLDEYRKLVRMECGQG